jgi:hypothetical protein
MNAIIGLGFAEMLFLLLFGGFGSGGMPLSLPPLPEDKPLVSAAPEECLLYLSWYGRAEARSTSKNETERLLAEPEIRHFVGTLWKELDAALRRNAFGISKWDAENFADRVLPLAEIVLSRPASAFVSKFELTIPEGGGAPDVKVQAGVIVNAGDRAEAMKKILAKFEAMLLEELRGTAEELTVDGVKLHQLPLPAEAPKVLWGFRGEYLIIAVGEGTAEKIVAGLKDARGPPKWLKQLHARLPVERPAAVTYVNTKELVATITRSAGRFGPMVQKVVGLLGFDNVDMIASVSGLSDTDVITKSLIATDGKPRGLLNLVSDKALEGKDLAAVPRDATFAYVTRFDAAKTYKQVLDMVADFNPRFAEMAQEQLAEAEKRLGFAILGDLLEPLGDVCSIYSSPSEGGLLVSGVNLVIGVKDRAKLDRVHQIALKALRAQANEEEGLEEVKFGGQTIYVLDFGRYIPLAPAWCLTDKELIVSLYPQTIKAFLSRKAAAGSLADVPAVAAMIKERPASVGYQDTGELFRTLYPFAQIFAPMATHEMKRVGFKVDASILPSAAAIYPHLRPSTYFVSRRDDGIYAISRESLPGMSGMTTSLPVVAALLLPAVQQARSAATRAQGTNNLRQLAIAMHNYHDVNGALPAPFSQNRDGKPLLSWRVHILPYLEQDALYRKFKLDEPWDSKHNKELIKEMPDLFKVPGGKKTDDYTTSYVVPVGESTAFPKGKAGETKGIGFGAISDGTSNTIMIVEAAPEKAVVWTKPDDWKYEPKKPKQGLVGHRPRGFLAALCDGSVRMISEKIEEETLKALFSRDGGEVVGDF